MKLLNKTIRSYLVYSFIILLVTIPLFYFVVKTVLLHAVDKSLKTQLREIRSNLYAVRSQDELEVWSKLDKDISLSATDANFNDSLYTIYKFTRKHHEDENEPYREIAGTITVSGKLYKLIISSSLVENDDLLGSILLVQTVLVILLMAGMLWINRNISKNVWQPFYSALNNMQQYELNKHTAPVFKESHIDEFDALNKAITNLFNRSHQVYLQQKEFTENAAHEMQTPLAIFQSKLDLLMQTAPLTEEQALLIHSLENTNQRLNRLNKSLLLLSKIENNQYPATEEVNIVAVTEKIIDQLRAHADLKKIAISEKYEAAPVIKANNTLVEILITNLLSNAIRYNIPQGKVYLEIGKRNLVIRNTGLPVALHTEKIFDRFHKENYPGGNTDSIGLGLAIAKKICEVYAFDMRYTFSDHLHCFTIDFL